MRHKSLEKSAGTRVSSSRRDPDPPGSQIGRPLVAVSTVDLRRPQRGHRGGPRPKSRRARRRAPDTCTRANPLQSPPLPAQCARFTRLDCNSLPPLSAIFGSVCHPARDTRSTVLVAGPTSCKHHGPPCPHPPKTWPRPEPLLSVLHAVSPADCALQALPLPGGPTWLPQIGITFRSPALPSTEAVERRWLCTRPGLAVHSAVQTASFLDRRRSRTACSHQLSFLL